MSKEKNIDSIKSIESIMRYMDERLKKNDDYQSMSLNKDYIEQRNINEINIDDILSSLYDKIGVIKSNIKDDIVRSDDSSTNKILQRLNEINNDLNMLEQKHYHNYKEEGEDLVYSKQKKTVELLAEKSIDRIVSNYRKNDLSEVKKNIDDLYKKLSISEEQIEQLIIQRTKLMDIIGANKECNTIYIYELEEICENINTKIDEKDQIQKEFEKNIDEFVCTIESKNNVLKELNQALQGLVK